MLQTISQNQSSVILRSDVAQLGSASQVSAVLRRLQSDGVLVRIGLGVYAKTRTSTVTGVTIPAGSLETLAGEAFRRLGIAVTAGRAARDYNSGATTQLPGSLVANTGQRRITRKLTVGGRSLQYENDYGRSTSRM
jgi:hypothetical protein